MLDMWFMQTVKADSADHLHETDQPGLQRNRQCVDLGIDKGERFDRPFHFAI